MASRTYATIISSIISFMDTSFPNAQCAPASLYFAKSRGATFPDRMQISP